MLLLLLLLLLWLRLPPLHALHDRPAASGQLVHVARVPIPALCRRGRGRGGLALGLLLLLVLGGRLFLHLFPRPLDTLQTLLL